MTDFDELYAAHYGELTVQLFAYFGDRQDAQDVVQEAFCRALARWARISTYDDPVAWVRRVAWNLATSGWRRRTTALNVLRHRRAAPPVAEPGPDRVDLIAALATLPTSHRRAMVLHYLATCPSPRSPTARASPRPPSSRGCTGAARRCPLTSARRYTMPDTVTDDEVRAAFARWRADELSHVTGPGTDVIHRAVRRRRATTVGLVATTVLAVAGAATAALNDDMGQPASPAAPAMPVPVSTGPDLVKLGEQASQALDAVVPGNYAAGGHGPLEGPYRDESAAGTTPAGRYRLVAACVGTGKTRFRIVQNGHAERLDMVCDGTTGNLEFQNQPEFALHVNVDPDAAADGHAGFAYRIQAG